MLKRLLTVALGLALGVALAALTAPANARPHDTNPGAHSGDSEQVEPQERRRYTTKQPRQHYAKHKRRPYAQQGRTSQAKQGRRNGIADRGLARYARSGGGASRSCLTGATRALLGRIEAKFGHVQIVSTCRPGARIAGSGRPSRHASGQAIDFNAPGGRKGEVVRWLIANHKSGGVMTYSGMNHIHVDIGPRFVSLGSRRG